MARSILSRTALLFALPLAGLTGLMAPVSCTNEPAEEPTGENFQKIVYAVRQHTTVNGDNVDIDVSGGMGQVMDYQRYNPGARLEIRDLGTGKVQNIIDDARFANADVSSLDVSFDATKVVFSMKLSGDDNYHLYVADLEKGDSGWNIHQLTFGPVDDLNPVWVAGGRIAFITNQPYTEMGTRADEYNHARIVSQIATVTEEGGDADRKLCSQNLSHTITLFAMKSGQIAFSRWEHLENVNDVKLFAMNPDCTQMVAVAGQHDKTFNSLVQVVETNEPNVFVGVGTDRKGTIQAGALIKVNVQTDGRPETFDEDTPEYSVITPSVPRGMEPSPVGRYRAPAVLPDGRILTSWADGTVNEIDELALTPPDFGIYIYNPETQRNELVVNYEGSWELYAKPIVKRQEPQVRGSIQNTQDSTVPVVLGSIDVSRTSLFSLHGNTVSGAQFDGTPLDEALQKAVKVRIIEGFSSEAATGARMFGLTMAEGAAMLGEATVHEDGSWLASIPPYVPVHLQAVDEFDLAIRNQTTWIQGMPGEDRVCGGCHERRTEANLPGEQQQTAAAAFGAENFMKPIAERTEYPWAYATDAGNPNEIQALLNAKCTSCHNETTNGSGAQEFYTVTETNAISGEMYASEPIPRMDLTDRPITVTYDNETKAWPASYVSIFYPSALEMEMGMGDVTVMGTVPPAWGLPSDARNSALIEKLNITSSLDPNRTAWPLGEAFTKDIHGGTRTMHPDDVGIELTREERMMLIRAIDMGGQFYARQNTGFEPFTNDPVKGKEY